MYKIIRKRDENYGNLVIIERVENGEIDPFFAVQWALKELRLWKESCNSKVRIMIDDQILSINEVKLWEHEEYKNLPKCGECGKILGGDVHTHQLCGSDVFCSQDCASKNYDQETERLKDEEEIDYL